MRLRVCIGAVVALIVAVPLAAQEAIPAALSLEEALDIARRNNPSFLQTENDRHQADWDVKQAYGQLLPSASANSAVSWQGAGEQQFGTLTLSDLGFGNLPSYYQSSYRVGLNYFLSYQTLLGPSQAKANRAGTEAQISLAESNLIAQVTGAYLEVLRQQEGVRLAQQQLENNQFNLRLAQGQLEVGSVTPIDVGIAEIQVGRSEVGVLQARNALTTGRMRLLQQMGVRVDQEPELVSTFTISEPTWSIDGLMDMAAGGNPALQLRVRSKESADIGVRSARSAYYPTLSLSTGWSGFTREASSTAFQVAQAEAQIAGAVQNCVSTNELYRRLADPLPALDCTRFAFTDANRQSIIDENNQFPFAFQRSPPSLSLSLSIPIFSGLTRQRNLEAAKLQRDDLTHQVREQEIALQADISVGLANVRTAYQSALLEQRNRDLADRQLGLARERYRLGAITFVELVTAQTQFAQADRDYTNAVFAYQDMVTNLEALVGASLRN
jgi:outer membrane protein